MISKHDTSTLANDPTKRNCMNGLPIRLAARGCPAVHRVAEEPDRARQGRAAVFQMMGMCQMLRDGVIPPNRSLDCVDDELAGSQHFVWVRDTLRLGGKFPLKAGLITSLGFGHVSGLIALVHPQAFLAALSPSSAKTTSGALTPGCWPVNAAGRGDRRRPPMYERPPTAASTTGQRKAAGGGDATEPGRAAWRRRRLPPVNGVIG
ncbi:beta-ketoacyl synthase, C-terminal domain protein [Mycobacterium xenopi 4042]|uniref:Beta-ketoacyl synthase, C-terminal domain protein n=1 Tax=Mycobacterium xenopi 4042 TaxID=1299334 RepID=X8ALM0_MYCXE|nr:beta-ketoacyl synthase, C-terminal domain protein [Mycobacterium xenopi 4042]